MNIHSHHVTEASAFRAKTLEFKILNRSAVVGVIGLGYVGTPLSVVIASVGFKTLGFDTNQTRVDELNSGKSPTNAVSSETLHSLLDAGKFTATSDASQLSQCDVVCICVPTPLSRQREPDLSFVESATKMIAANLKRQQLVVLESTTYPGTTEEVVKPILEATGLAAGIDFYLGYSPEREDPGNDKFTTVSIPKVVSGDGSIAQNLVRMFYASFVDKVVPVSSVRTAEVVKITENVFRAVNIALINELKVVYAAMGIDVWEVIGAASTKPFGFMPFYPGPGLGGHCIPVDPFYLTWKSREFGVATRFIELAGEINQSMPKYVIARLEEALDSQFGLALSQASVLVIGVSYKKNVSDIRESPSLKIMESLIKRAARLDYHDPLVAELCGVHDSNGLKLKSVSLEGANVAKYDAVVILTDHDSIDFEPIASHSRLIVDTRNALRTRGHNCRRLVHA